MNNPTLMEWIRGWISTGALVALVGYAAKLQLQNRKLTMQSKVEDRQGFGTLIDSMSAEVRRLSERVADLERGKEADHKLIIQLLAQLNRNQAVAILASHNVSDELRPALEAAMGARAGARK
jgi:ABC-type sugar transport system substrate-binding protein